MLSNRHLLRLFSFMFASSRNPQNLLAGDLKGLREFELRVGCRLLDRSLKDLTTTTEGSCVYATRLKITAMRKETSVPTTDVARPNRDAGRPSLRESIHAQQDFCGRSF